MATTTTNFGWDIPQSTDLVKDGATAIAALGQDIDTAFVDFKGGTTGQVLKKTSGTDLDVEWGTPSSGLTLINTTSFSGVTSQSFNNVFSATYDVYRIVMVATLSTAGNFVMRLRASGSDNSTASSYTGQFVSGAGSSVSAVADTETFWNFSPGNTNRTIAVYDIAQPFAATETVMTGISGRSDRVVSRQVRHNQTVSYDGFSLFEVGGTVTLTGYVQIFGYSK